MLTAATSPSPPTGVDDFPINLCTVEPSRDRTYWKVTVRRCVLCGSPHWHGGGSTARAPLLGHRSKHCLPQNLKRRGIDPATVNGYVLVQLQGGAS